MKKTLDTNIIGANITNRPESNLLWPNQIQLTLKHWTKKIRKIKQRYCITNSLQLKELFTIDKWIEPHNKLTRKYKWLFSPRLREVYQDFKIYSCKKIAHWTFSISNEITNQDFQPPTNSYPIYVQQNKFTININIMTFILLPLFLWLTETDTEIEENFQWQRQSLQISVPPTLTIFR